MNISIINVNAKLKYDLSHYFIKIYIHISWLTYTAADNFINHSRRQMKASLQTLSIELQRTNQVKVWRLLYSFVYNLLKRQIRWEH